MPLFTGSSPWCNGVPPARINVSNSEPVKMSLNQKSFSFTRLRPGHSGEQKLVLVSASRL